MSTEGVTPMVVGLADVNNGAGDRWFGIRDRSVTEWSPVCLRFKVQISLNLTFCTILSVFLQLKP